VFKKKGKKAFLFYTFVVHLQSLLE